MSEGTASMSKMIWTNVMASEFLVNDILISASRIGQGSETVIFVLKVRPFWMNTYLSRAAPVSYHMDSWLYGDFP